ncbi:MAG: phosphatase PAP2 family protein [Maritimibacter sp.]
MTIAANEDQKRARALLQRMAAPENLLASGTLLYALLGGMFLALIAVNPFPVVLKGFQAFALFGYLIYNILPIWLIVIILAIALGVAPVRRVLRARAARTLVAVVYCSVFVSLFSQVKNGIPLVFPFWADQFFTRIDVTLHLGHQPYDLIGWLSGFDTSKLSRFYLNSWVIPASFFPALLVACDPNAERRRVFILLWMAAWVVLGNLFAAVFLSYGPIFSDLFQNGPAEAHAGPLALLERADARGLLALKMRLWGAYSGEVDMIGSGISAFPSVHVGMAAVIGLYVYRLGRDLACHQGLAATLKRSISFLSAGLGGLYVLTYLALSVYLGWHYAVDGYAAVIIITGLYVALAKTREENAQSTPQQSLMKQELPG